MWDLKKHKKGDVIQGDAIFEALMPQAMIEYEVVSPCDNKGNMVLRGRYAGVDLGMFSANEKRIAHA